MGTTRPAPAEPGEPAEGLLSPATRPLAAVIVAGCVATTALLGVWLGHGAHTDPVDTAIDSRVRAGLAGHPKLLELLARPGDLPAIAGITAILVLACLLRRRYRGAALLALSVPAAAIITERLLKPLVGRTALGFLSFPSGHATGTFALATAITVLLAGAPRAGRLAVAVIAFALASVVAAAMIALGFHYFTDAIAGAAVGIGTVLATALVIDLAVSTWRRFGRQPPAIGAEDRPRQVGAEGSLPPAGLTPAKTASPASSVRVPQIGIRERRT
jgi:membrane-associated phospholipid phosphatase